MKELVVISGKGGTGKTSIVAAFASICQNKVVVDCDVDAADLHLILKPNIEKSNEFFSGKKATINLDLCIECNQCISICRFGAVSKELKIDQIKCEGCGACFFQCPVQAIDFEESKSGDWFESNTRFGKLIHAKLGIAEGNSGKLVSTIKQHARTLARNNNNDFIIVDGSPGIGCPVIASLAGTSLALIIIEPTFSSFYDAKRVAQLAEYFNIKTNICINKYDLNLELAQEIESFFKGKNISCVGKIPYNELFTQSMVRAQTIIEFAPTNNISTQIIEIWDKINSNL